MKLTPPLYRLFAFVIVSWFLAVSPFQLAAQGGSSAIQKVVPSVVRITVTGSSINQGPINNSGTGFFVSRTGEILTARHTVAMKDGKNVVWKRDNQGRVDRQITVEFRVKRGVFGDPIPAQLGPVDEANDVAIIRVQGSDYTPVSCSTRQADDAEFLSGLGYQRWRSNYDHLSGAKLENANLDKLFAWRVGDNARGGHSGGPVFDGQGIVLGLIVANDRNGRSFFATPLARIPHILDGNSTCRDRVPRALSAENVLRIIVCAVDDDACFQRAKARIQQCSGQDTCLRKLVETYYSENQHEHLIKKQTLELSSELSSLKEERKRLQNSVVSQAEALADLAGVIRTKEVELSQLKEELDTLLLSHHRRITELSDRISELESRRVAGKLGDISEDRVAKAQVALLSGRDEQAKSILLDLLESEQFRQANEEQAEIAYELATIALGNRRFEEGLRHIVRAANHAGYAESSNRLDLLREAVEVSFRIGEFAKALSLSQELEESIEIDDLDFTHKRLKTLARLYRELAYLHLDAPVPDGLHKPLPEEIRSALVTIDLSRMKLTDISPLSKITKLKSLNLQSTRVTNLQPLSQLKSLEHLNANGSEVTSLSSLASLPRLQSLYLNGTPVTDFRPLASIQSIVTLSISGEGVLSGESLQAISELRDLRALNLSGRHIAEPSLLGNLVQVRELDLRSTGLKNLAPLSRNTQLRWLNLGDNEFTDVSPIRSLTRLEWLNLQYAEISDIRAVAGMTGMRHLGLGQTLIYDLGPIAALGHLETLMLWHSSQLESLEPLRNLSKLQVLNLHGTPRVSDLSPLKNSRNMRELDINATSVGNVSALSDMKLLEVLDINRTNVADLTPLQSMRNLRLLNISSTQVGDLTPLSELERLQVVIWQGSKVRDTSAFAQLPNLVFPSADGDNDERYWDAVNNQIANLNLSSDGYEFVVYAGH